MKHEHERRISELLQNNNEKHERIVRLEAELEQARREAKAIAHAAAAFFDHASQATAKSKAVSDLLRTGLDKLSQFDDVVTFACDKLSDPFDTRDFLRAWRDGDLTEWEAFNEFVEDQRKVREALYPEMKNADA